MPPVEQKTPTPTDTTRHVESPWGTRVETQFVTATGVTVIVSEAPPPPPPRRRPEPVEQAPQVVIRPPGQAPWDREALMRRLVAEHSEWLGSKLRAQGVGEESTKDVRQEIFMVLVEHMDERKGPPSYVRAFLRAVARNVARNHRREWKPDVDPDADADAELWSAPDPQGMMEQIEGWERLERYIGRLPKPEAEALRCMDFEAMTVEEAALSLKRPVGTAATQVRRARKRIEELARESDRARAQAEDERQGG